MAQDSFFFLLFFFVCVLFIVEATAESEYSYHYNRNIQIFENKGSELGHFAMTSDYKFIQSMTIFFSSIRKFDI